MSSIAKPIAIELKLTLLVGIYALFKALTDLRIIWLLTKLGGGYDIFVIFNRIIYFMGHAYLFKQYSTVTKVVQENNKISTKEKLGKKREIKHVMRWIIFRAFAMGCVHLIFGNIALLPCTLLVAFMATRECEGWQAGLI